MSDLTKACLLVCLLPILWLALMACEARAFRTISTVLPADPHLAIVAIVDPRLWPIRRVTVRVHGYPGHVVSDGWGEVRITPVTRPIGIALDKEGYASHERWLMGPGRYRIVLYPLARANESE